MFARREAPLEWAILDNLSDDWECPATICPEVQGDIPGASRQDVMNALYQLHERGLIAKQDGQPLNREALASEPEDNFDTPHWFGLNSSGCAEWEAGSDTPIDWSEACSEDRGSGLAMTYIMLIVMSMARPLRIEFPGINGLGR